MPSQDIGSSHAVNHYAVLQLPQPHGAAHTVISRDDVKTAYHKALLINHPDKAVKGNLRVLPSPPPHPQRSHVKYTVDEIIRAFQTLSQPSLKAQYDRQLLANRVGTTRAGGETFPKDAHIGVETVDLEDLAFNDVDAQWSRACRCGDEQGYMVTEADLEKESEGGEIYVGCRGCSLVVKVLFSVVQEDSDG